MRERRIEAACDDRCHEVPAPREVSVSDGIYALMDGVEVSGQEPPVDLMPAGTEIQELIVRDHTALRRRDLRHASRDE
jgi:hypothetical protein